MLSVLIYPQIIRCKIYIEIEKLSCDDLPFAGFLSAIRGYTDPYKSANKRIPLLYE